MIADKEREASLGGWVGEEMRRRIRERDGARLGVVLPKQVQAAGRRLCSGLGLGLGLATRWGAKVRTLHIWAAECRSLKSTVFSAEGEGAAVVCEALARETKKARRHETKGKETETEKETKREEEERKGRKKQRNRSGEEAGERPACASFLLLMSSMRGFD